MLLDFDQNPFEIEFGVHHSVIFNRSKDADYDAAVDLVEDSTHVIFKLEGVELTRLRLFDAFYTVFDADVLLDKLFESLQREISQEAYDILLGRLYQVKKVIQGADFKASKDYFIKMEHIKRQELIDAEISVDIELGTKVEEEYKQKKALQVRRGPVGPKKVPAKGILSPVSIIRGTNAWFYLRGRSEVNFKFCQWPEQYDMASFLMKNSLMTIDENYEKIFLESFEKPNKKIYNVKGVPFRYCKAPGFQIHSSYEKEDCPVSLAYMHLYKKAENGFDFKALAGDKDVLQPFYENCQTVKQYQPLSAQGKQRVKTIKKYRPDCFNLEGLYFQIDIDEVRTQTDLVYEEVINFDHYQLFGGMVRLYTLDQLEFKSPQRKKQGLIVDEVANQQQVVHNGGRQQQEQQQDQYQDFVDVQQEQVPPAQQQMENVWYHEYQGSIMDYFSSIVPRTLRSSLTMKQPVYAFAILSNWIMGNTVYLSTDFTLQIMSLMARVTPQMLLSKIAQSFTLSDYQFMVFNNDFDFFKFSKIVSFDTKSLQIREENEAPNREAIENKHIISVVLEQVRVHSQRGPWVVETVYYDPNSSTNPRSTDFVVIKMEIYDHVQQGCFQLVEDGVEKSFEFVVLNLRGYKSIEDNWFDNNFRYIYSVFDGLYNFIKPHNPPNYYRNALGQRKVQSTGTKYRYYLECNVYKIELDDRHSYQDRIQKTAIRNLFYCLNKYQYYSKHIFQAALWRCMFGVPSIDLQSQESISQVQQMQLHTLMKRATDETMLSMMRKFDDYTYRFYTITNATSATLEQQFLIKCLNDFSLLHHETQGMRFGSKFAPRITALCHSLNKRLNFVLDISNPRSQTTDQYVNKSAYCKRENYLEIKLLKAIKTAMYSVMFYMQAQSINQTLFYSCQLMIKQRQKQNGQKFKLDKIIKQFYQRRSTDLDLFLKDYDTSSEEVKMQIDEARQRLQHPNENDDDIIKVYFYNDTQKRLINYCMYAGCLYNIKCLHFFVLLCQRKAQKQIWQPPVDHRSYLVIWNSLSVSQTQSTYKEDYVAYHSDGFPWPNQDGSIIVKSLTHAEVIKAYRVEGIKYIPASVAIDHTTGQPVSFTDFDLFFDLMGEQVISGKDIENVNQDFQSFEGTTHPSESTGHISPPNEHLSYASYHQPPNSSQNNISQSNQGPKISQMNQSLVQPQAPNPNPLIPSLNNNIFQVNEGDSLEQDDTHHMLLNQILANSQQKQPNEGLQNQARPQEGNQRAEGQSQVVLNDQQVASLIFAQDQMQSTQGLPHNLEVLSKQAQQAQQIPSPPKIMIGSGQKQDMQQQVHNQEQIPQQNEQQQVIIPIQRPIQQVEEQKQQAESVIGGAIGQSQKEQEQVIGQQQQIDTRSKQIAQNATGGIEKKKKTQRVQGPKSNNSSFCDMGQNSHYDRTLQNQQRDDRQLLNFVENFQNENSSLSSVFNCQGKTRQQSRIMNQRQQDLSLNDNSTHVSFQNPLERTQEEDKRPKINSQPNPNQRNKKFEGGQMGQSQVNALNSSNKRNQKDQRKNNEKDQVGNQKTQNSQKYPYGSNPYAQVTQPPERGGRGGRGNGRGGFQNAKDRR